MKVYPVMCGIQRPLDSQDDIRIATETRAVLGILRRLEAGRLSLVVFESLLYELEMKTQTKSLEETTHRAISVPYKELG
jgi:hypothetical protein